MFLTFTHTFCVQGIMNIEFVFCRESEDTALLILKEIYKSMGVQPEHGTLAQ